MTHTITITPEQFENVRLGQNFLLTKCNTDFEFGDTIELRKEGTRDLQQFVLLEIVTGKEINKYYCLLYIKSTAAREPYDVIPGDRNDLTSVFNGRSLDGHETTSNLLSGPTMLAQPPTSITEAIEGEDETHN